MSAAPKLKFEAFEVGDLKEKTFHRFAKKMYQIAGVNLPLTDKNLSLVKNRLSKLVRVNKMNSFEELADAMDNPSTDIFEQFVSALTTNKTHFFREEAHFDFLKKQLEHHFDTHSDLRIWCAASSIGAEPYTLAMVVKESVPEKFHSRCRILATDIDLEVLKRASEGVYTSQEMDGVPSNLRLKYFEATKDKQSFRAKDSIVGMVHFARFNLVQNPFDFGKPFHFVFCRNVLIYFDPPTTKKVIASLASCVQKDGYLILGHSESGTVNDPQIKPMSQATYKKL